jgi:hypothetical protein
MRVERINEVRRARCRERFAHVEHTLATVPFHGRAQFNLCHFLVIESDIKAHAHVDAGRVPAIFPCKAADIPGFFGELLGGDCGRVPTIADAIDAPIGRFAHSADPERKIATLIRFGRSVDVANTKARRG